MQIGGLYEEICPPSLLDLVYTTDNAYNKGDILAMQTRILSELQFDFTFPTALSFLETYQIAIHATDLPTELYCRFLLEMSLVILPMQKYPPSTLALAALVVA